MLPIYPLPQSSYCHFRPSPNPYTLTDWNLKNTTTTIISLEKWVDLLHLNIPAQGSELWRLPAAWQEPRSPPHGQLSFFEPPTKQAKGFSWQEREPKIQLTPPWCKLLAENTANNYFALKTTSAALYHVNLYGHSIWNSPQNRSSIFLWGEMTDSKHTAS